MSRVGAYLYDSIWLIFRPTLWRDILIVVIVLLCEIFAMPGVALLTIPSETPLRDTWREGLTANADVQRLSALISFLCDSIVL